MPPSSNRSPIKHGARETWNHHFPCTLLPFWFAVSPEARLHKRLHSITDWQPDWRSVWSVFPIELQYGNGGTDGDGMQMSSGTKEAADIRCIRNVYVRTSYGISQTNAKVCYGETSANYRCPRFTFDLVWPTLSIGKSRKWFCIQYGICGEVAFKNARATVFSKSGRRVGKSFQSGPRNVDFFLGSYLNPDLTPPKSSWGGI